MNSPTTMSRIRLEGIREHARAMSASFEVFRTGWRQLLPPRPEAKRRWRLALIAVGLLACPLSAAPAPLDVTTDLLTTRLKSAGASAVCKYPQVDSQKRTRADLDGHGFWVHRASVNWDRSIYRGFVEA
jgi:hypothetical protein